MGDLISVVIPTYNRKDIVLEAIQSVLQQIVKGYEILVVDDGSSDTTVKYLNSLHIPEVTILRNTNKGVSHARNMGIKKAKGDFIAFLDSDDLWLPTILEEQLYYLKNHHTTPLVYTNQIIEVQGKRVTKSRFTIYPPLRKYLLPGFISDVAIQVSSTMVRRNIFNKVGLFNELLRHNEDIDMFNRISEISDLGYITKPLSIRRLFIDELHLSQNITTQDAEQYGTIYLNSYLERRKNRSLTEDEAKAVEKSRNIIKNSYLNSMIDSK